MATIAENLNRIQSAKTDIRTAIEAKGVTVPSSATIDTYDTYVSQISGGILMPSKLSSASFNDYGKLTSATIRSGVTSIDGSAFSNCQILSSCTIPNSVTSIGYGAFDTCSGLRSITIPNSVTRIGDNAFYDCSSLTSVTIPDSVTSIDFQTFTECISLTSCTIGSGVTSIGDSAFQNCSNLTSIVCNAATPATLGSDVFADTNDCPIYVPAASLTAYQSAWSDYSSRIVAIPAPSAPKWIATYTGGTTSSAECDSTSAITNGEITLTDLVSVEIGNCVTTIDAQTFGNCSSLSDITIPDSVTSIGSAAFNTCTSLTLINIPDSVTSIGNMAFYGCGSLTGITINATTPPTLGTIAFGSTNDCPIYVPAASLTAYQSAWSDYASRIQAIPGSYKWIATYSGGTITTAACDSTSAITMGEINNTDLVSVEIGECVTSIGYGAFDDYTSITSCTIGSGVTSIGGSAFRDCRRLASVTIYATTPATLGGSAFDNTNDCPIYVPAASLTAYQSATGWSNYSSRLQAIS